MNFVPGEGPLNAKMIIVGECPGERDIAMGRPFKGASGGLLDDMLAHVGLSRKDIYITYVSKSRPPAGFHSLYKDKQRRQPSASLTASIEALHRELKAISPGIIVAFGEESLRALAGHRSIDKWRGSLLRTPHGLVIATYAPSYVFKMYETRAIVELDLRRARKLSTQKPKELSYKFTTAPTLEMTINYLQDIKPGSRLALDIETTGERVRCLGIATSATDAICIPFMSYGTGVRPGTTTLLAVDCTSDKQNSHWSIDEELLILA